MKKKVVPKLRQEVKGKVDIVTSDDIKIYYTWKFQDFTARYIIDKYLGRNNIIFKFTNCWGKRQSIFMRMVPNYGPLLLNMMLDE